jgi:predicted ATPase/DNA-binding SARP family transcriptional activator
MVPLIKVTVFGSPKVQRCHAAGTTAVEFRTTKALALFCYLAVTRQPHARPALAALLWGDDPAERALNSLRVTLNNLHTLFPDHIEITRQTVAFRTDQPYTLDLAELAAGIASPVAPDGSLEVDRLLAALALYQGEFLDELFVDGAPTFETWLLREREHWRQTVLTTLGAVANELTEIRRYEEAIEILRRMLALEPWCEAAHAQLMRIYSRMGQFSAALAQYEECRRRLADELDVEPMPETEALYERIQAARTVRPYPLPAPTTPFVGRAIELEQIHNLLANPACRLLTLVGFGGAGKTRLALEAARQANVEHALLFVNGVGFVSLHRVQSTEALVLTLAEALGLSLSGRRRPLDELIGALRNREQLLVLDNFEDLLDASGEQGLAVITELLACCPHTKLLVTSRLPLQLPDEWRLDVEGLPCPDEIESTWAHSPALQLFLHTASQLNYPLALTAETVGQIRRLCRLVGGMPLALQMAAGWLPALPLPRIIAELEQGLDLLASRRRDLPARQRTMRAIFDSTWARLNSEEQTLFSALAVFEGGFDEAAMTAITGASPQTLAGLADRALLQAEVAAVDATDQPASGAGNALRYTMHALTSHYAQTHLQQDPAQERALRQAHCGYYTARVRAALPFLYTSQEQATLRQLRPDHENILAAWRWAIAQADHAAVHPLSRYLFVRCLTQNWFEEGERLFGEAARKLAALDNPACQTERAMTLARLLSYQAMFQFYRADYAQAAATFEASLDYAQAADFTHIIAFALTKLAEIDIEQSAYARAATRVQTGLRLYSEVLNDLLSVGICHRQLSTIHAAQGDYQRAVEHAQQSRALTESLGSQSGMARALHCLGVAHDGLGEYALAQAELLSSLSLCQALGNHWLAAMTHGSLGLVYYHQGELTIAWEHALESERLARTLGDQATLASALEVQGLITLAQGQLEAAQDQAEAALALNERLQRRRSLAFNHLLLGKISVAQGECASAWHQLSAAYRQFEQLGHREGMACARKMLAQLAFTAEPQAAEPNAVSAGLGAMITTQPSPQVGDQRGEVLALVPAYPLPVAQSAPQARARRSSLWRYAPSASHEPNQWRSSPSTVSTQYRSLAWLCASPGVQ